MSLCVSRSFCFTQPNVMYTSITCFWFINFLIFFDRMLRSLFITGSDCIALFLSFFLSSSRFFLNQYTRISSCCKRYVKSNVLIVFSEVFTKPYYLTFYIILNKKLYLFFVLHIWLYVMTTKLDQRKCHGEVPGCYLPSWKYSELSYHVPIFLASFQWLSGKWEIWDNSSLY